VNHRGLDRDFGPLSSLTQSRRRATHSLLSIVTTNLDALYEEAAEVPFASTLAVLPEGRMPGRPPWLLKMHGDLNGARSSDDLVFTTEQYSNFERDNGPLGAVLQSLMVTRHLIFVGYSLRDEDFVRLATEVARVLHDRGASYTEVGTVLALTPTGQPRTDWESDLQVGGSETMLTRSALRRHAALKSFLTESRGRPRALRHPGSSTPSTGSCSKTKAIDSWSKRSRSCTSRDRRNGIT